MNHQPHRLSDSIRTVARFLAGTSLRVQAAPQARRLPASVVLACALILPLQAALRPARANEGAPEIMKVAELRAGMRGYGLTTFSGSRVQKFDVEVLGVLRGWAPQGEVVLIRMSSPVLDQTGTVAGMSGSPVYIGGKLLGAVAYGFWFCKIPLAGVTPAEEMLVARDTDLQAQSGGQEARKARYRRRLREQSAALVAELRGGRLSAREAIEEALGRMIVPLGTQRRCTWGRDEMPERVRALLPRTDAVTMAPLPVPLAVGGVGPGEYDALVPLLQAGGFFPVLAGAAGQREPRELNIEPGMPVGAIWIGGDLDISSLGTLTMLDGDRVLAFGHSMLGTGETDFPLALGSVQTVVPSTEHSFRLTSAERVIGRLTQDRDSAIVGRLGEESPMFPCTLTVKGARDRTFHYTIAPYWEMSPLLTFYVSMLSVLRWEGEGNLCTVRARSSIRIKDWEEPLVLENTYAGFSPVEPAFELVWLPLEALVLNEFRPVEIEAVDVQFQVDTGLRAARIVGLRVGRRAARPGEKLDLWVTLKEFQGEEHIRKIEFVVPPDAEPGTRAPVIVCDAMSSLMMQMSDDPGFFYPRDFEGLIAALKRLPSNTRLYAHGEFVRRGVRYRGSAMPQLPDSVTSMLAFGTESGMTVPLVEDTEASLETPWVIEGMAGASVLVADPRSEGSLLY